MDSNTSMPTLAVRFGTASPSRPLPPFDEEAPKKVLAPPGYVLEEMLGSGGMAVVHRAREIESGRMVALKLMRESMVEDERLVARFRREGLATSRLDNDNVVRVLDFAPPSQPPFIVAELVDGGSLNTLMMNVGPMPPLLAAMLVDDLLSGLAYAHANGFVHRDIKPANLLLTSAGRLKVNDFGIASSLGENTLSAPGDIIGTPSYMSPEQALGLPVGPASDLFSVGTVLYEMITGANPFAHESQRQTLAAVSAGLVKPIFDVDPTVPPGIERLLHALLEADPASRCKTAEEALHLLRAARADIASTPDDVARRVVLDPAGTAARVRADQTRADVTSAHALLARGSSHAARAAFLAFRASCIGAPGDLAHELHASLSMSYGFHFNTPPSSALRALDVLILAMPGSPDLLKRAAIVARDDGDLLRAASLFKRYLRRRPNDEDGRERLVAIVGDDVGVPRPARHVERAAAHRDDTSPALRASALTAQNGRRAPVVPSPVVTASGAAGAFGGAAVLGEALAVSLGSLGRSSRGARRRRLALAGLAAAGFGDFRHVQADGTVVKDVLGHAASRALPFAAALFLLPIALSGRALAAALCALALGAGLTLRILASARRRRGARGRIEEAAASRAQIDDHTPRAFAAALRELSRDDGHVDDDVQARALLERAACSLVLEQRAAALGDLEATLAVMAPADLRRRSVATIMGLVRQL